MRNRELILYRDFKHRDILECAARIFDGTFSKKKQAKETMNRFTCLLVELAVSHGYSGNIWQAYLTYLIANNENAYSTSCEMRGGTKGSVSEVALHDFSIFREMFRLAM